MKMEKRQFGWVVMIFIVALLAGNAKASLVAHYEFEGNANDSAGSNNGTRYGDASFFNDPQRGQVLSLDGNGDYVSLSANAVTTTEFTVATWANQLGFGGGTYGGNPIFCQRDDAVGDNRSSIHLYACLGITAAFAGAGIRSSNGAAQTLSSPMMGYKEWHHYAVTVNSIGLVFYIDGIEMDRAANNQSGNYITSIDEVDIGRHWYRGIVYAGFFNGLIDDVRIYNTALSQEEIMSIVPEPATLLLFGMGAVMLRNRRFR